MIAGKLEALFASPRRKTRSEKVSYMVSVYVGEGLIAGMLKALDTPRESVQLHRIMRA